MRLVWVTGVSGAGKSTVCEVLKARGIPAIDTDWDGFNHWVHRQTGEAVIDPPYPTPTGWIDTFAWKIDADLVRALASSDSEDVTFLFGTVENEDEVWDYFAQVGCLVVDDATLRHRLETRTTNLFGKQPAERDLALEWNSDAADRYRSYGATIIDATRPLEEVVTDVLALDPT